MTVRARWTGFTLTPWTRAVAGDTASLRLPSGYRITGLAKTARGPWTLELFRPGHWTERETQLLASHVIQVASEVRPRLESLVDIAAIHEFEQGGGIVVRTDRAGWVRSIEDA